MRRFGLGAVLLASVSAPAIASDVPRYEPAPAWVIAPPAPAKPIENPSLFQVIDQQTRIADNMAWNYHEIASRAISAEALARIGTVQLNWQPYHGDVIVHRIDIIRDGQHIDLIKAGQKFNVIRREQGLEQLELNGMLTAVLQVEGLRVGDVLDVAYSTTTKDPALKGNVQTNGLAFSDPFKVDFARARFLWPTGAPVKWKAYPAGIKSVESDKGGWHELTFTLPAPKQPDLPPDAPRRYRNLPVAEAATFPDWQTVSKVFAPLYDPKGLIAAGSPLAQEIDKIAKATRDPKQRAAAALSLVQDRVRYFANGMNGGNYTPQAPDKTWSVGYGDCKAKTLLLLAILHGLGVDAEPVLASIQLGDYVPTRLPTPGAFDHVFVHAKLGQEDLWMDGTGRGSRIEDLNDAPPFRWVLPLNSKGAELVKLPTRAPAQPTRIITVDIDDSAGIGLPAPFEATAVVRGGAADMLRAAVAQLDKEKLQALALATLGGAAGTNVMPVSPKFSFDNAAGTATVTLSGVTFVPWQRQNQRYRFRAASILSNLQLGGDRARPSWKDIPIATGEPQHLLITTRIHLPDNGAKVVLEGDQSDDLDIAGRRMQRKATLQNGVITIEDRATMNGIELQPADMPPARAKLAGAQSRLLRIATTTDYPAPYAQTAAAKKARKLDKTTALYTQWIADKSDDTNRYVARAGFYEASYQWREALADLDKAVEMDGNATNYFRRGAVQRMIGDKAKATADFKAGLDLQPDSKEGVLQLGLLQTEAGQKAAALATVDEHISTAGEDKPEWLQIKAEILSRGGDATAAIAALDEAIATKPGSSLLLNQRCWTKGTLNVQLDSALKDCTQAIELAQNNASAAILDSRALVYFRLNKPDEALTDLNAALDMRPGAAGSLYLRGVIEKRTGKGAAGDADIADAKMLQPRVDEDYTRWKVVP